MRHFLPLAMIMAVRTVSLAAAPALWLPGIFSDHLVVQAGRGIVVWGKDLPGTQVQVDLDGSTASAQADPSGRWTARLAPHGPGGPYTLKVSGSADRDISDVLVGEVWLGSGQSNMELATKVTKDRATEIPKAGDPQLRLFTVDRTAAFDPQEEVPGHWQLCTPDTVKDFSAVAYHFARDLRAALHTPVGMIVACWGGTPGEDWVPRPALDAVEPFKDLVAGWDREPGRKELWSLGMPYDLSVRKLRLVRADGSSQDVPLDGWSAGEKPGSSGADTTEDGTLRYQGRILGGAWGSTERPLASADGSTLDVRPFDHVAFEAKGSGTFTLLLGQPSITDYDNYASAPFTLAQAWSPHSVPLSTLKQGGWGAPAAFTPESVSKVAFVLQVPYWPDLGAAAYNGMIAPLTRLPLRGVLWYQGESNAGRADQYSDLLQLLVRSWREAWADPDLAFLTVQLPGYAEAGSNPCDPQWARLRAGQAAAMAALPRTGLAVTLDVGELDDVHPKDKKPVGHRLSLLAQNLVYGRSVEASGPQPRDLTLDQGRLRCTFTHADGLTLKSSPARSFELAGVDGVFHRAHAEVDGGSLLVWSRAVGQPRSLRYAWADDPQADLFNGDGLPAAPFRVDLP